ncbi:hypothetical protein N2152v2_000972 [Parachlorella kessleri]
MSASQLQVGNHVAQNLLAVEGLPGEREVRAAARTAQQAQQAQHVAVEQEVEAKGSMKSSNSSSSSSSAAAGGGSAWKSTGRDQKAGKAATYCSWPARGLRVGEDDRGAGRPIEGLASMIAGTVPETISRADFKARERVRQLIAKQA